MEVVTEPSSTLAAPSSASVVCSVLASAVARRDGFAEAVGQTVEPGGFGSGSRQLGFDSLRISGTCVCLRHCQRRVQRANPVFVGLPDRRRCVDPLPRCLLLGRGRGAGCGGGRVRMVTGTADGTAGADREGRRDLGRHAVEQVLVEVEPILLKRLVRVDGRPAFVVSRRELRLKLRRPDSAQSGGPRGPPRAGEPGPKRERRRARHQRAWSPRTSSPEAR